MKKYGLFQDIFHSILSIMILLFLCQQSQSLYAQKSITFRVSGGYSAVSMNDPNTDLKDTYNAIKWGKPAIQKPNEINGGFLFSADIMYKPSAFSFGAALHLLSSKGDLEYADHAINYKKNYSVKTFELEGVVRYSFVHTNLISTFYQAGAGCGSGSVIRDGLYEEYANPQYNVTSKNDVSGSYFAGHIQAGLEFVFHPIRIGGSAGYRLANADVLKGPYTENGTNYGEQPITNINGQSYKYNFTGVTFGMHVLYEFGL